MTYPEPPGSTGPSGPPGPPGLSRVADGQGFTGELGDLLAGVQRLMRRRLRRGLTTPRLRGAQVELLRLVAGSPGIRVSAAARELCLAGNSVSTLVNQLVRAGLLTREADPEDGRAVHLAVTAEATARLGAWDARRRALLEERVALLPEADREALHAALPALRRLADGLRTDGLRTNGL